MSRKIQMADVVRAHMEVRGCPVLTSNQCHAIAMNLNCQIGSTTAYDEAKERELFISEFKLEGKIYYDKNTKQWLPASDTIKGFQMAERTLGCWIGWSACAKSRARSAE